MADHRSGRQFQVFLRCPRLTDNPEPAIERGYEVQIDDRGLDPEKHRFGSALHLTGAIYKLAPGNPPCLKTVQPVELVRGDRKRGWPLRFALNGLAMSRLESASQNRSGYVGLQALQELSRRKPLLANRTPPEVEAMIVALSVEQPAFGQIRIAHEVRQRGQSISPAGVRSVWQRHDLETMKKRLKTLEAKIAHEGLVLTEGRLAALEKASADGASWLDALVLAARSSRHLRRRRDLRRACR